MTVKPRIGRDSVACGASHLKLEVDWNLTVVQQAIRRDYQAMDCTGVGRLFGSTCYSNTH
jgi:hypothetical protein